VVLHQNSHGFSGVKKVKMLKKSHTVREGQFRHTSAEIKFPHLICRSPHHPKPTRCHAALFIQNLLNLCRI
jgi:hypothetical protein